MKKLDKSAMAISDEQKQSLLKNIKYIALLGGVLILTGSYFLGYSNLKVTNDETKAEIEVLQARYDDLNEKMSRKKEYEEGVKTFTEDTEEIMKMFDYGLSPKRLIVEYQDISESLQLAFDDLNMPEPEVIYNFASASTETGETAAGVVSSVGVTVEGNYGNIKEYLQQLVASQGRRRVPTDVSFNFDSTLNSVSATVTVKEYAMIGAGAEESVPVIPEFNTGMENIFFSGGMGGTTPAQ